MATTTLLDQIESAEPGTPEEPKAIERLILKHAMKSFGRRGYAATTLRGIAADVSVTAPLVSYYFKSKENLYARVAEIVMQSLSDEVARVVERRAPFYETVVGVVEAHLGLAERSPGAVEFMFTMLYGPEEGQPPLDLEGLWRPTPAAIHEVFERAIASQELLPRTGVTAGFLVLQLGNLIHSQTTSRFKAARLLERHPEKREEIGRRLEAHSLDVALEHFFFGAGDVPELSRERTP